MHRFLRSVGFSNLTEIEDQDKLLQDVLVNHDAKNVVRMENGQLFAEISREFAPDIGITVCGQYDRENLFRMEYYYPYFRSSKSTTYKNIGVERHYATRSFAAACDDARVGTTLIFYLTNAAQYLDSTAKKIPMPETSTVSLSALSDSGTILLPVIKNQKKAPVDSRAQEQQNSLFEAAQSGDQEAMEQLTMQDIDAYSMISRRIQYEDVYTIVDSYLIPYGLECDLYNIMGDITDCNTVKNSATGETVVQMGLICNDIPLDVCINRQDLIGEPAAGRRFKGIVWIQGSADAGV